MNGHSQLVDRLLIAKGLRAFGDGFVSLQLPVFLLELGFRPLQVGVIATATLFSSGLLTLLVGLYAYRYRYRTLKLAATLLMADTAIFFWTGVLVLVSIWSQCVSPTGSGW